MRQITDAALAMIESDEGLRLNAYRDLAGITTIGFGHTGADVHVGETITRDQALALLRADVAHAAAAIEAMIGSAPTTDDQFSAMVSLAFNIGTAAFRGSTVLRKHRAGDHPGAAAAFLLWDKAHINGQLVVVAGLLQRRNQERLLYLGSAKASA